MNLCAVRIGLGCVVLCCACAAPAEESLDAWHREAAAIRELAENDAVAAYQRVLALRADIPPTANAADRAGALNLLARIEMYLARSEDAANHAHDALEVAEHSGDRIGQAEAHLIIGVNSVNLGKAEALDEHSGRALELLDGIDRPDLMGEVLLRKSMAYRRAGRFDDSVTMAMQAMEIARQNKNELALTYAFQGIGLSFAHSERWRESLNLFTQMRDHAKKAHSRLLEAEAIAGIADSRLQIGDPQGAESMMRSTIALYRQAGVPFWLNQAEFGLANIQRQEGHADEAIHTLDETVNRFAEYSNPIGMWYALAARSADYQTVHNLPMASADAKRAYELAKSIGYPLYLSRSARQLAGIAAANGDPRRAYQLSVEADDMADKAARGRSYDRMIELTERYEAESRQRKIRELTQRTEQQDVELAQRALERRWIWTVLGSVIVVLAGAVLLVLRQRQAERREAALSEARQLARQRSEFLARMSHELRTPLNAILGFAQILQRDGPLNERQARGLKIIDESGQHLRTLIDDVLDLARIDAARIELSLSDVNLPAFLQLVCDIIRLKAAEHGLVFDYQPAADLPATVRVDKRRLRQVLLNLLSNAVRFSDRGRVTLRVLRVPTDAAKASAESMARLRFEIADQGIGISAEQLERLFQPFEQVSDAERREGGTGLGLAISRQLVRLMGGDIQVQSLPQQGSVFWFEIDVMAPRTTRQVVADQSLPIGYVGARRRILVVDDVEQNRTMLAHLFGALGFEVAEASDSTRALEAAARMHPDLVVMDLTMPVADCFEAMRQLRLIPECKLTPIVVSSAGDSAAAESLGREAGASMFLAKPIRQAALLDAVGTLLDITWVGELAPAPSIVPGADDHLVPPPLEEMTVLHGLARLGNMRSIAERADHVQGLDPKYGAFADRLRTLAQGYQSRAISALIERYHHAAGESGRS